MNLLVRSLSPSGQQPHGSGSSASTSTSLSSPRRSRSAVATNRHHAILADSRARQRRAVQRPSITPTSYQPHMLFDLDADPPLTSRQRRSLDDSLIEGDPLSGTSRIPLPSPTTPTSPSRSWFGRKTHDKTSLSSPASPESFDHFEYFYNYGRRGGDSTPSDSELYPTPAATSVAAGTTSTGFKRFFFRKTSPSTATSSRLPPSISSQRQPYFAPHSTGEPAFLPPSEEVTANPHTLRRFLSAPPPLSSSMPPQVHYDYPYHPLEDPREANLPYDDDRPSVHRTSSLYYPSSRAADVLSGDLIRSSTFRTRATTATATGLDPSRLVNHVDERMLNFDHDRFPPLTHNFPPVPPQLTRYPSAIAYHPPVLYPTHHLQQPILPLRRRASSFHDDFRVGGGGGFVERNHHHPRVINSTEGGEPAYPSSRRHLQGSSSLSSSLYRISFIETNVYIPQDVPASSSSPEHLPSSPTSPSSLTFQHKPRPHRQSRLQRHLHGEWVTETVAELKKLFQPPSGVILVNVEKKSKYPFIIFGPLVSDFDTSRFLPTSSYQNLSPELRINDGIYDICGILTRPGSGYCEAEGDPVSSTSSPQVPILGYVVSAFQTFPGEDSEKLEDNWITWTGAQILYKYLPMSAGLRRLVFYKRHDLHLLKNRQNLDLLSSGGGEEHAQEEEDTGGLESEIPLISYVLLCECLTLSESILASVCAVIDQLRARCCGYSALYINYSLEGGSQQQLQQQHLTSSSATTTVTRTSGDVYHHHQQQPILHPLEQPQVPPTAMAESVLHSTYLPGHLHHHPSPAAHQQTGSLRYQQHLPLQPHPYDR